MLGATWNFWTVNSVGKYSTDVAAVSVLEIGSVDSVAIVVVILSG